MSYPSRSQPPSPVGINHATVDTAPGDKTAEHRVHRVLIDLKTIQQSYRDPSIAPNQMRKIKDYVQKELDSLAEFMSLWPSVAESIDCFLLDKHLRSFLRKLDSDHQRDEVICAMFPFKDAIMQLHEERQKGQLQSLDLDSSDLEVSKAMSRLTKTLNTIEQQAQNVLDMIESEHSIAPRVLSLIEVLIRRMKEWYGFFEKQHHTEFAERIPAPYKKCKDKMAVLRSSIAHRIKQKEPGPDLLEPMGRDELVKLLDREMIAYTPEELAKAFRSEMQKCRFELQRMAVFHGWKDAAEGIRLIRADSVQLGRQSLLVSNVVEKYAKELSDMVTIPSVVEDSWRPYIPSAEAQRKAPFILGGLSVNIAYRTVNDDADTTAALMRFNNRHSTQAIVFHKGIPGHCLQNYAAAAYSPHRRAIGYTPCHFEGWAFYWETLLRRDVRFKKSTEYTVATIAWRAHRFARALGALEYHAGRADRAGVVGLLVEAGLEPAVAEMEADATLDRERGALHPIAYAVGERQFWALREERVVAEGQDFEDRRFHDRILQESYMPVELLRCLMTGERVRLGRRPAWRFLDRQEFVYGNVCFARPAAHSS
jgi:hypothetical protein